jgi:hypothetical protein
LEPIRHGGGLQYIIQAQQGGFHTLLTQSGIKQVPGSFAGLQSPFQTMIIDELCQAVVPEGSVVHVPDLFENDGQTAVILGPGAVAAPGTLCIKNADAQSLPPGPGGAKPVSAYSVTLKDSFLSQTAQLVLSYPSDANGKVLNSNATGGDLAIYSLGLGGAASADQTWYLLSRPQVDTTLHTVTGTTPHFSTFALFAGPTVGTADLRAPQRIITPNGDGINDKAVFKTGIDEVKIFDVRGRRVRTIAGPAPEWDGTGDNGAIVESGVYIYQFTAQGERVSGVIMVAK